MSKVCLYSPAPPVSLANIPVYVQISHPDVCQSCTEIVIIRVAWLYTCIMCPNTTITSIQQLITLSCIPTSLGLCIIVCLKTKQLTVVTGIHTLRFIYEKEKRKKHLTAVIGNDQKTRTVLMLFATLIGVYR